MTDDLVLVEHDPEDAFMTVTLNRPDKLNAMSVALCDALDAVVEQAAAGGTVRAMILTGAGRAFSTGFDLNGEDFEMDVDGWLDDIGANCRRLRRIWEAPFPTIAAVNGHALAGGLELMMVCDLAVAAASARFGEPEVRHVSGPPSLMMPWTVPMRHARWLMYSGDMIGAEEAARIHLVNRVVPDADLMETAQRMARKLARIPGDAVRTAKDALNRQQELAGFAESWAHNRQVVAELHASPEGCDWMRALKGRTLRQFLDLREAPFRDLDAADRG